VGEKGKVDQKQFDFLIVLDEGLQKAEGAISYLLYSFLIFGLAMRSASPWRLNALAPISGGYSLLWRLAGGYKYGLPVGVF